MRQYIVALRPKREFYRNPVSLDKFTVRDGPERYISTGNGQ